MIRTIFFRDSIWYVADRNFVSTIDDEMKKIIHYEESDKFLYIHINERRIIIKTLPR